MEPFFQQFLDALPRSDARRPVVLELGCWKGKSAALLAEHGVDVVAIDKRDLMIARHPRITFVKEEMIAWLKKLSPNVTFDGIVLRNVLQFMKPEEVRELLPLVARHVGPNGVVGIQTFYHPTVPAFRPFPFPPISYWGAGDLQQYFSDCMTVMAVEEPDYHPDASGKERQFFMTNVVVKNA